jgi:hypothetical protein
MATHTVYTGELAGKNEIPRKPVFALVDSPCGGYHVRLLRAIGDFFSDLGRGDPVALVIAGVFLLMAAAVAATWIFDMRRRKRESKGKKPPTKDKPRIPDKPTR